MHCSRNYILGLLATIALAITTPPNASAQFNTVPQPSGFNDNAALHYYQAMAVQYAIDEEDWTYLLKTPTTEIDKKKAGELIGQGKLFFPLLQRGANVSGCDWGLKDYGIDTLIVYLRPMRQYTRILDLRAHQRFLTGDINGAMDDLLTSLKIARHINSDAFAINRLLAASQERNTISVYAAHAHRLNESNLRRFRLELAHLEFTPNTTDAAILLVEKYVAVDWLAEHYEGSNGPEAYFKSMGFQDKAITDLKTISDSDGDRIRQLILQSGTYYDQAIPLLKLPYAQRITALEKLTQTVVDSNNPIAKSMFPSMAKLANETAIARARFAMLQAGIAHQLGEENIYNAITDPGTEAKPFMLNEDDESFTLTSKVVKNDEAITIRFSQ